ncbi:MAG: putative Adenylate cyclase-associated CAP [Streblomastix strix]|uniref:Putative Adenylate cyclase-associated CAP n=1 Tax=Streblomastix strix TaxID=222440 RepID=A0A5J4VT16_9EUKA|nr:MAG: putative Adenylate cyclase-associated CAP [Streblomastix strix]
MEEDEVKKNPFDDYIEANFPPLIAAAAKVPEKLRTLTGLYEDVVKAESKILAMALVCQKPTTDELKKIYEPVGAALNKLLKVIPFKSEPIYNEGKAIEEAAKTANWITVGDFFALKSIKEHKESDPDIVAFVRAIQKTATELLDFVKQNHRTGLSWNLKGIPVSQYKEGQEKPKAAPVPPVQVIPIPPAQVVPIPPQIPTVVAVQETKTIPPSTSSPTPQPVVIQRQPSPSSQQAKITEEDQPNKTSSERPPPVAQTGTLSRVAELKKKFEEGKVEERKQQPLKVGKKIQDTLLEKEKEKEKEKVKEVEKVILQDKLQEKVKIDESTGGILGLRHVKPEEKTKNRPPEERVGVVPADVGSPMKIVTGGVTIGKSADVAKPKQPIFMNILGVLKVENQLNNRDLDFSSEKQSQSIYIFNCKNSVLKVHNKIKSITIDKSVNVGVVVEDVISSIECINSKDIAIEVTEGKTVASVLVESSEGAKIYLSAASAEITEVFSSKSANINIYAPGTREDPDTKEIQEGMIEHALPSTLKTILRKGQLINEWVKFA